MTTALVIHGHFYQPPRENPWTEMIDREASAHPFHDWNERIHNECYRPNAYARIVDSYGRVERIVNNYANISFNFGPTLLNWLERHHPSTYARIIDADRASLPARSGHGNAIAQGYHHVILPLCNERDRRTQVRWGISDFRYRFGREPESLWLPETACNDETLGTLIDEGLNYVILSPHQAARVRPPGTTAWTDVSDGSINPSVPYKYFHRDGSGRSIAIFFYDGSISRAIAFDGLLGSSRMLIDRCVRAARADAPLVHIATDGESYGHHFHFGDRCLAYALETEAAAHNFRVTNYGEFLAEHPPSLEAEIKDGADGEGTAWSCAHGVGRWTRDCGCHAGAQEGWNQKWRTPLRAALDFLRDDASAKFESAAGELLRAPWATRDAYVELLSNRTASREEFMRRHASRDLNDAERMRALTLLELQRQTMVMYTSCGWFFNDISGLETVQVLRYAGRALELMDELELDAPHARFLEILAEAQSNVTQMGNGADIFRRAVQRSRVTPPRVAAHIAISNFADNSEDNDHTGEAAGYTYLTNNFRKQRHGRMMLVTAHLSLESNATGRLYDYALAAMHFGDVDYYCALKPFGGAHEFESATERLWTQFRTASVPVMLRVAQAEFGPDEYGLEHLLPQGRQRISETIFSNMVEHYIEQYEFLYEENRRVIEVLQGAGFELPEELRAAAEFTVAHRFEKELREQAEQEDAGDYHAAFALADEAARLGYRIKRAAINRLFAETVTRLIGFTIVHPSPENFQSTLTLIALAKKLNLEANLEHAQEAIYEALQNAPSISDEMRKLAVVLGLSPPDLSPKLPGAEPHPVEVSLR